MPVTTVGQVRVMSMMGEWYVWMNVNRDGVRFGGTMVRGTLYGSEDHTLLIPHLLSADEDGCVLLPRPSDLLMSLVRNFHETGAVRPLLDCLVENYPVVLEHADLTDDSLYEDPVAVPEGVGTDDSPQEAAVLPPQDDLLSQQELNRIGDEMFHAGRD